MKITVQCSDARVYIKIVCCPTYAATSALRKIETRGLLRLTGHQHSQIWAQIQVMSLPQRNEMDRNRKACLISSGICYNVCFNIIVWLDVSPKPLTFLSKKFWNILLEVSPQPPGIHFEMFGEKFYLKPPSLRVVTIQTPTRGKLAKQWPLPREC